MPQAIAIAVSPEWRLSTFAPILERLAHADGATFGERPASLHVTAADRAWYVRLGEYADQASAAEDCATNDFYDPRFVRDARSFRYFSMVFTSLAFTRELVREVAMTAMDESQPAWFDTDYGWVIDAPGVLAELAANPAWDWRHPLPTHRPL